MQKSKRTAHSTESTLRKCIRNNTKYPEEALQVNVGRKPTLPDKIESELVN
jgi:hypothetical protein